MGIQVRGMQSRANNLFRVEVDGDDETVETQHFGENEDEDHADEEARLLSCAAHAGVADDANGETSRQTGEAYRQTGSQMDKTTKINRNHRQYYQNGEFNLK